MASINTFSPDYAVPPGETLREVIEEKGLSQTDLAIRAGLADKTISQIMNGVAPISYETAEKLEMVLGVPARFWNNRESQYREALMREKETARFEQDVEWLSSIPIKQLIQGKFVAPSDNKGVLIKDALKFFQVHSVEAWKGVWVSPQARFRGEKSQIAHPGFVAAGIRIGELAAETILCAPYDESRFKLAIREVRDAITKPATDWWPLLQSACADAGVAVVLVKEIESAGVSGVTKWLTPNKALIVLSLKYKTDDQFWFSFFHEVCHILKHGRKAVFIENGKKESADEVEADRFASEMLIPSVHMRKLRFLKSKRDVKEFANSINCPSGVVVGRMQHEGIIRRSYMNDLKVKFDWAKE